MWTVIFGRHFKYLYYKEFRYETRFWLFAAAVYWWWQCRYSMTMYPVKYLKIYWRNSKGVVDLSTYNKTFEGKYRGSKQRQAK